MRNDCECDQNSDQQISNISIRSFAILLSNDVIDFDVQATSKAHVSLAYGAWWRIVGNDQLNSIVLFNCFNTHDVLLYVC